MMKRFAPRRAGLLRTLAASGALILGARGALAAPRAMIYVALVTPADERAKSALLDWGGAFKFGLDPLIAEIAAANTSLAPPQIVLTSVSDPPSVATLKHLADEGNAVQVSSAISRWSQSSGVISMTIYLGALKGTLASPIVILQQKIVADDFRTDQDALALATLYAFGNEALLRDPVGNRAAACGFFARARLIGRGVGARVPEIAPLRTAVSQALLDHRCGPH